MKSQTLRGIPYEAPHDGMACAKKIKFGTGGWRAIIGDDFTRANISLLAKAMADKIEAETVEYEGDIARIITGEMSVSQMHAKAKEIRAEGGEVFFAAIGG